jgi:hypothetical protein
MTTEVARRGTDHAEILERVIIGGDLSPLAPADRIRYYRAVCDSLGVNPLTKPFEYLTLNGRLILYARKDCTDQLRARDSVSITDVVPREVGDLYVVTAKATDGQGRTDMATGAVNVKGLGGEALANAMMKAETKAKRRVTLSLCGLGMLDESEVPDTPGAQAVDVDPTTGEVRGDPPTRHDEPPARQDPNGGERPAQAGEAVVTENQIKRLMAIAGKQWTEEQLHELIAGFQYESRKQIKVKDYDWICDLLKRGPIKA